MNLIIAEEECACFCQTFKEITDIPLTIFMLHSTRFEVPGGAVFEYKGYKLVFSNNTDTCTLWSND
jgi:hypothetical protein